MKLRQHQGGLLMQDGDQLAAASRSRRAVLEVGLSVGLGLTAVAKAADAATPADPAKSPPQPGDRLSYMSGPNKGQIIKAADLKVGEQQVLAFRWTRPPTSHAAAPVSIRPF
jgi:hypothetical protein